MKDATKKKPAKKKTASMSLTGDMVLKVNEDGRIFFNEPSPLAWQKWLKALAEAESMDMEKIASDASAKLFDRYFDRTENLTVTGPGGKEIHFNQAALQYLSGNRKWSMLLTLFSSRSEFEVLNVKNS